MAAMIGFLGGFAIIPKPPLLSVEATSPIITAFKSAPEEKTLSLPVIIATLKFVSLSKSSNAVESSSDAALLKAFFAFGRLIFNNKI